MWVARDKDKVSDKGSTLNLFEFLPYRITTVGKKNPKEFWSDYSNGGDEMELDENEYPEFKNLKWEDEPIEVDIIKSNFLQQFIQFKEWLFGNDCDGRLHAIRDKFEELKLDKIEYVGSKG